MSKENIERVIIDTKLQIEKSIDEFKAALDQGTSDPDSFITLAEIEKKWAELKNSTNKTYSDMIAAYLSDINESDIIKAKKENT